MSWKLGFLVFKIPCSSYIKVLVKVKHLARWGSSKSFRITLMAIKILSRKCQDFLVWMKVSDKRTDWPANTLTVWSIHPATNRAKRINDTYTRTLFLSSEKRRAYCLHRTSVNVSTLKKNLLHMLHSGQQEKGIRESMWSVLKQIHVPHLGAARLHRGESFPVELWPRIYHSSSIISI